MYEAYWHLTRKPFERCSDSSFYYPGETHQGALLKLRYAVESRAGAAVLAGASGTGKSMLVQSLRRQLPESYTPFVHVVFPLTEPQQLLAYLAGALEDSSAEATPSNVLLRIERRLNLASQAGQHAVIVIDEAQVISDPKSLEALRLLLNFESPTGPSLTLILVGYPTILPALDRAPQLEERLAVKCLLRPLALDETAGYIHHRLRAAGSDRDIFTAEAIDRIHELSNGNPRRINRLCDLALLVGFAQEQPTIGPDEIESIAAELITVTPE